MKPKDLLGIWKGTVMRDTRARCYDVLVFKEDGTGFLDLYSAVRGFSEQFRWSVEPAGLRLEGSQRTQFDPERMAFVEVPTTLNVVVPFRIREDEVQGLGPMRILEFEDRPWPGMSEQHLFYRRDLPALATFQAPCFVLAEEGAHDAFRGKALSDYLAQQLEARQVKVGERYEVFMGCCYYRNVEIGGRELGLAVNGEKDSQGWWLRIDRPPEGGTVELDQLHDLLQDILQGVEGLHSLKWQTEDEYMHTGEQSG
jgi:hypothetical protein